MAKDKSFICIYECRMGETEIRWHHLAEGESVEAVAKEHAVEHENGLDTDSSPIGGACGQYFTELMDVKEITPIQKEFLNSIGIH
jgi:hypothetical protein